MSFGVIRWVVVARRGPLAAGLFAPRLEFLLVLVLGARIEAYDRRATLDLFQHEILEGFHPRALLGDLVGEPADVLRLVLHGRDDGDPRGLHGARRVLVEKFVFFHPSPKMVSISMGVSNIFGDHCYLLR